MKPLIETPPRTIMEVFRSLPEGTLAEVINNQIYMSPSPVYNHQEVLLSIASQLRAHCATLGGRVVIAPFDVYLDETSNAVQPDIVVILSDNRGILNNSGHFHGVPDLVVEILSPHNRDHDLVRKKGLYEKFGIKEYWIVDPEDKSTFVYQLTEKSYELRIRDIGRINSTLLSISFDF